GQIRDSKGKIAGNVRDTIKIKLPESVSTQLAQRQIQYDTGFTLSPGEYNLRFLVRENLEGKLGTFETKFTVPAQAASGDVLRLSSAVWSSQREPLSSALGVGETKKLLEIHPLVTEGQKLIPSITRVFNRKQNLYVYFEVYDPATDGKDKAARV